jgi:hypothetical protein
MKEEPAVVHLGEQAAPDNSFLVSGWGPEVAPPRPHRRRIREVVADLLDKCADAIR